VKNSKRSQAAACAGSLLLPILLASTISCSRKTPATEFEKTAADFVYTTLSFSPVTASGQGLHLYNGKDFDRELDDFSFAATQKQRDYYIGLHKRLEAFDKESLSPEDRADYDVIDTQIGLSLFDLDIAQSWRHSPQTYVELLGSALFNPFVLDYAPKPERYEHIVSRLQKIPQFIETARRQIGQVPPVWARVAKEENDGNIDLIDRTLREGAPANGRKAYDLAAAPALDSLRGFNKFLENDLPKRAGNAAADWRLGEARYRTKFKLVLATDRTPDEVLKDAETRLKEVRAHMLELSLPLHAAQYPGHGDHGDLKGDERVNKIVREVLDGIAEKHSTPSSYMDDARKALDEARDFARARNLLTLPGTDNLQVIPTPEFERGIYAVGGFNPAPVLEPRLGAFFWITPIPADWPKARIESKLREYNFYNLKLLVIHEAMPGHYVQDEFANAMEPKTRRALRAIYGNGPYVEGWAQYITQTMLDEGLLDNSAELRLTLLKQELRVDANAIIDIRIQTNRMTDDQAMDLMEKSTFQEHEEAVAKLQRVKLSSTQLPTYFVGWRDWLRVRELERRTKGNAFNLHDFDDRALREGAVSLPILAKLLTGKELR
jgi:uncharacterized protein (DUF885 family)